MSARELAARFVAPCCWRESLATHQSPEAAQLRQEVGRRLAAGEATRDIEAALLARYGPRLLRVPEGRRGQWLFAIPGVALGLGAWAIFRFLRRQHLAALREA